MSIQVVRAIALSFLVGALPASAQFSITPLSTFGSGGWLAPNGYNGSTYLYLTNADTERGLACGNSHLYLVSRNGGDFIRILDAKTGADLGALNLGSGLVSGGTYDVNLVAVGGDGAIYVGNLATGPAAFRVYRWANDLTNTTPTVAYSGVPLAGARIGDSLAAITSAGSTLLAAGFNSTPSVTGNSGYALIDVTAGAAVAVGFGATPPAAGDFRLGITFTDASHVIGTQGGSGNALRYSSFSGSVGTLLASPVLASTDERALAFGVVGGLPLLAALSTTDNHVSLYDLTDPTTPVLVGQANATSGTLPADSHNTGAVAWGEISGNTATLYAMATDDGIQAFTVTVPVPAPPTITAQPQSQTVAELAPTTFQVAATGNPPLTYQWYQNGGLIAGATNASFTIPGTPLSDNRVGFSVAVADVIGGHVYSATSQVATLTVIADTNPPTVIRWLPAAGSTLSSLGEIEVHFSKGVKGVAVSDLLVNGLAATNLTAYAPDVYVFDFPQPANGLVQVGWSPANNITDLSASANRFAGGTITYTLNPAAITSQVLITEFMADNKSTIRDEDGQYSDWLELYNSGGDSVDLGGWYLTDTATNLTKWRFPQGVTLLSRAYMLVWASGNNRTNPAAPLHTNFKLSRTTGSYLALVYLDGSTIVSAFPSYPQQYANVSYGRDRVDPSIVGYFTNATPGAANLSVGAGFAPAVLFSVSSRTFQQPFTLTLSLAGSNAVIHYLVANNGTSAAVTNLPTISSPVYAGPLTISSSVQVRARAFATQTNYFPGPPHNETYLQLSPSVVNVSSDLPIVVFHDLGGGAVSATADQFMTMQVFDTTYGRSALTNPPDLAVQGYFHRRGQATFWDPKPNLRVQTEDEFGDNLNVALAGFPADNDWVFYGIDEYDKVLMHNPLTHSLYRDLGHYSSRTRYLEVYLKVDAGTAGPVTTADYYGLYVLEEKIKIGKNRVAIDQLQPENTNAPSVTGGYLLSIDKANPGNPVNLADVSMWYLDPDYYAITSPPRAPQQQYINDYFSAFYSALTGPNWTDPVNGYAPYIDMSSWIDYHLHQTLVFNVDALRISAFFYKPRNGPIVQGPLWDFDRCFGTRTSDDGRAFNPRLWRSGEMDGGTDMFNPGNTFNNPWYGRLFLDPDFFQHWIDRYQQLRQGVYSLTNLMTRIDCYGDQVRAATPREYARWAGSGSSDTTPRSGAVTADGMTYVFPTPGTWQGEINFTKWWFSNRVDFMDANFLNPPIFSTNAGPIPSGYTLAITAPTREANSTVYYTLDGTDPRLPGGAVNPAARSGLNTATVTLTNNSRVFARDRNANHRNLTGSGNPPLSSPWSGPLVATFYTATPPLRITELMYNPPPPPAGNTNDNDNFEFIEFQNTSAAAINLQGYCLSGGVSFTFGNYALGAGQYVVLVKDLAAFQSRYPGVNNIAGVYTNSLGNNGDHLVLTGPLQEPILDFSYDNNWYPATGGQGFSLVIRDSAAPPGTWGSIASWRPSSALNGSPGQADPAPPAIASILVNEALTHHTGLPEPDTIELFNPTASAVNLGGWFLTDNPHEPKKYRIPAGFTIAAGHYLTFTSTQFGVGPTGFGLSSTGDSVYVFSGDANTNLTGYGYGFSFGAAPNGVTFGRYVNSQGQEFFVLQSTNTLGAQNALPRIGPVVIAEFMYHPPDLPYAVNDTLDEYIELLNITTTNVPLYDVAAQTNTWRLGNAVTFAFPTNIVLPPAGRLLVVSFDPIKYPATRAAFVAKYGPPTNIPVYGPWSGALNNGGDTIELNCPDTSIVTTTNISVPYYLVEAVAYNNNAPWPTNADGAGAALQRLQPALFANDPTNWQAVAPFTGLPILPHIAVQPSSQTVSAGTTATFVAMVSGSEPLSYQWFFNATNALPAGTNATLVVSNVQLSDAGTFQLVVTNILGSATSQVARLTVVAPPQIGTQPGDQAVAVGGSAGFWVTATGTPPLSYRWYYNTNTPLSGSGTNLLFFNVQTYQAGTYQVVISNAYGVARSRIATLRVLVAPTVVPGSLNVTGTTVSMSLNSLAGLSYQLEYKDYLTQTDWVPILPVVPGTGTLILLQDTNALPAASRFYRVSCF
jgi:hypothetical protein